MLNSSDPLVHYDPSKELVLPCDASPYGLGEVLSHIVDGKKGPSCTPRGPYLPLNEIMPNWIRRDLWRYLDSRSSISTCTDRNSRFLQTTSRFWVCLRQIKVFQPWQPMIMNWSTERDKTTATLVALVGYLCRIP